MKATKRKPVVTRNKKVSAAGRKSLLTKMKKSRGVVDAGTVYAIILLGIVVGGGILMLGNTSPQIASPDQNQPVIRQNGGTSQESNLQLDTFPGITLTPTPSPSPTPTPTPPPPPPASGGGGGGGGGSTCFVAGTKVLMADGSQKNIEDVKIGDRVKGYDGKKQVVEEVTGLDAPLRDHHYNVKLADGTVLGMTNEHPLYTTDGWKSIAPDKTAKENPNLHVGILKVGDKVLKSSGQYVAIVAMDYFPGPVQAYNLKNVTGFNDFFANGVLAHNKGGGGGGSGSSGGSAL